MSVAAASDGSLFHSLMAEGERLSDADGCLFSIWAQRSCLADPGVVQSELVSLVVRGNVKSFIFNDQSNAKVHQLTFRAKHNSSYHKVVS